MVIVGSRRSQSDRPGELFAIRLSGAGFRDVSALTLGQSRRGIWEFPKIRGTLSWGPYNRILLFRVLY